MAIASAKGALLSAATAVALCMGAVPAFGQEAVIAACQALPTEAERFGCLADALRLATGQATMTADDVGLEAPAPAVPAAVAPAAAAPAPAPAAMADPAERRGFRLPFVGGRDDDRPEPTRVSSTSATAAELGAAQVREREEAPRVAATVVAFEVVGYKQLQVELDNGQVWRQTGSEEPWDETFDDDPTSVEIWETRFGGYRMRLTDRDEVLAVERQR